VSSLISEMILGACRRIRSLGPCARRKSNARKGLGYLSDKLLAP